jgi:hypothetical protein
MAEIGLSVFSRQCLGRRIPDMEALLNEILAWDKADRKKPVKIEWRFTAADAWIKLKKLYPVLESC